MIQAFLREFEVPLGHLLIRRGSLPTKNKVPVKGIPLINGVIGSERGSGGGENSIHQASYSFRGRVGD